jgi:hypothetical protein
MPFARASSLAFAFNRGIVGGMYLPACHRTQSANFPSSSGPRMQSGPWSVRWTTPVFSYWARWYRNVESPTPTSLAARATVPRTSLFSLA